MDLKGQRKAMRARWETQTVHPLGERGNKVASRMKKGNNTASGKPSSLHSKTLKIPKMGSL